MTPEEEYAFQAATLKEGKLEGLEIMATVLSELWLEHAESYVRSPLLFIGRAREKYIDRVEAYEVGQQAMEVM